MRKTKLMLFSLSLLLVFSGCRKNEQEQEQGEKTMVESTVKEIEETTDSSVEVQETEESNEGELITYQYDPGRPLLILVEGTDEILVADGNYHTTIAMESVTDNEYRKQLQEKYDDGYVLAVQQVENEPTGFIELKQYNEETELLEVGKENIDIELGKQKADQMSDSLRKELSSQIVKVKKSKTNKQIEQFDEAVVKAKELMGIAENDDSYLFYDFGLKNDGREYYNIIVRQSGSDSDENVAEIKVYSDNGQAEYINNN